MTDQFQLVAIASVQSGLLAHLAEDPTDIVLKIAALRAAADLMSQALSMAALAQSVANIVAPRR
jgi:hypothetical protein